LQIFIYIYHFQCFLNLEIILMWARAYKKKPLQCFLVISKFRKNGLLFVLNVRVSLTWIAFTICFCIIITHVFFKLIVSSIARCFRLSILLLSISMNLFQNLAVCEIESKYIIYTSLFEIDKIKKKICWLTQTSTKPLNLL